MISRILEKKKKKKSVISYHCFQQLGYVKDTESTVLHL